MHFPSFLFPMLFGAILLLVVLFVVIFAVVCYINKAMKEEKIYPKTVFVHGVRLLFYFYGDMYRTMSDATISDTLEKLKML